MNVVIKPISEGLIDGFCRFFEHTAFTDNGEWAGCYCFFYHFGGSDDEFNTRDGNANRASATEYIREGRMTGYLAYLDDEPIGWCNVNDRDNYDRIKMNTDIPRDGDGIASIVCFIVAPGYRGMGIATRLLERICDDYADKGYRYLEAYPRKGDLTNAQHYHGTMSMYSKKGFVLHKGLEHYDIVRKRL